jgi:MFS family permease
LIGKLFGIFATKTEPWPTSSSHDLDDRQMRRSSSFESLTVPNFRWFWLGSVCSFLAMQMQFLTRGWLIYDMTESPIALALIVTSFALPLFLFSLMGGALADRWPKRTIIITTQLANAASVLVVGVLVMVGEIQFWHLLLTGVVNGLLISMNGPSRQAIIPEIVGRARLVNATALTQTGMNATRIGGSAVAGVLIVAIGVSGVYFTMAILYTFAALAILKVTVTQGEPRDWSHWKLNREMVAGLKYVYQKPILLSIVGMSFVAVLLGMPFNNLMPAYVAEALDGSASELGFLLMISGIGAVVGSFLVARFGSTRRKGMLLMVSIIFWGFSLLAFSLANSLILAATAVFVVGVSSSLFMTFNASITQLLSTEDMYGRVMSVSMMTFGLMPLGVLPISAGAEVIGTPHALAFSAVLLIIASLVFLAINKSVRQLEI